MVETKVCTKCTEIKLLDQFNQGYHYCKQCRSKQRLASEYKRVFGHDENDYRQFVDEITLWFKNGNQLYDTISDLESKDKFTKKRLDQLKEIFLHHKNITNFDLK